MNPQSPAPDVLESQVHGDLPMPVPRRRGPNAPTAWPSTCPLAPRPPACRAGIQTRATNEDTAQTVHESVEVPPGDLDLPGTDGS